MKLRVLFLDYLNECHSQIAEGFYNYYVQGQHGRSAGISDGIGRHLPLEKSVTDCLQRFDINHEQLQTKQFKPHHVNEVDVVIYVGAYEWRTFAEQNRLAIAQRGRFVRWPVRMQAPLFEIRDEIHHYVEHLVEGNLEHDTKL